MKESTKLAKNLKYGDTFIIGSKQYTCKGNKNLEDNIVAIEVDTQDIPLRIHEDKIVTITNPIF
jgi:hypothetical protein